MTIAMDTPIKITRHDVPDPRVCDLGDDGFRTDDVVTVECGGVTGTLFRYVDWDPDEGTREVLYEARLDGSDETGGFCNWCACTPGNLHQLNEVALVLQHELAVLQ